MRKIIGLLGVVFLLCLVVVPVVSASVIASNSGTVGGAGALSNSHPSANSYTSASGQVFNATVTEYAYNITLRLNKETGITSGNLSVALCTLTGSVGEKYFSSLLETSDVLSTDDLALAYNDYTFNFSGTTQVTANTTYGFYLYVVDETNIDNVDFVNMAVEIISADGWSNTFYYHDSAWDVSPVATTYMALFTINGEVGAGSPTPTPTPVPSTSAGDGDATLEYWGGIVAEWIFPMLLVLVPAVIAAYYLGKIGFIIGLNIGVMIWYVVNPSFLWAIVLLGIVDVMYFYFTRE